MRIPNILGFLTAMLVFLAVFSCFVSAGVYPSTTPSSVGTSTSLFLNYTVNDAALTKIIFNWNGTNTTLFSNGTDGLVLLYNFDKMSNLGENDTNIFDQSYYHNNNATARNDLSLNPIGGNVLGGFNFTGKNFSALRPNIIALQRSPIPNGTSNYTISVWIKRYNWTSSATQNGVNFLNLIGEYSGRFMTTNNYQVKYNIYNVSGGETSGQHEFSITPNSDIYSQEGTWDYYVVTTETRKGADVTLDWRNITMFKNGLFVNNISFYGDVKYHNNNVYIGGHNGQASMNYLAMNGSVDGVTVWNRTMKQSEIIEQQHYSLYRTNFTSFEILNNRTNLSVGSYSYYVCIQNSSGFTNCSDSSTYEVLPVKINISINFSNSVGLISDNFYGAVSHTLQALSNTTWVFNGTDWIYSDVNWHLQQWFDAGLKTYREDMRLDQQLILLPNTGGEFWVNNTWNCLISGALSSPVYQCDNGYTSTSGANKPYGWVVQGVLNGNGSIKLSTDKHSGVFSVNISSNDSSRGFIQQYYSMKIYNASRDRFYNFSAWVKTSNVGMTPFIRLQEGCTPYTTYCNITATGTGNWEYLSCVVNISRLNQTEHCGISLMFQADAGETFLWDDVNFTYLDNDGKWKTYYDWFRTNVSNMANIDSHLYLNKLLHENGIKYYILSGYTPQAFANLSTYCYSSYPTTCPAYDNKEYTRYMVEWLNYTTNNCEYCDTLGGVLVHNEPDLLYFWLMDVPEATVANRVGLWNELYNATYTSFKTAYPQLKIISGAGLSNPMDNEGQQWLNLMLPNTATIMDGIDFHNYAETNVLGANTVNRFNNISRLCDKYSANCSTMILSEVNNNVDDVKNISSPNYPQLYQYSIGKMYIDVLGFCARNLSYRNMSCNIQFFDWAVERPFNISVDYPTDWTMVEEPNLAQYSLSPLQKGSYNVTKAFATYHRSGSTIVNSTSGDNNVVVLGSKYGANFYITIVNGADDTRNLTITVDNSSIKRLRNTRTGQTYDNVSAKTFYLPTIEVNGVETYALDDATATLTLITPTDGTILTPTRHWTSSAGTAFIYAYALLATTVAIIVIVIIIKNIYNNKGMKEL